MKIAKAIALRGLLGMTAVLIYGFTAEDFAVLHPRGRLGAKLMRVENLMHTGEEIPLVRMDTPLARDVARRASPENRSTVTAGILDDMDLR